MGEDLQDTRPLDHLSPDRRDVHPIYSGLSARELGLDSVRHSVGADRPGRLFQNLFCPSIKDSFTNDLPFNGLASHLYHQTCDGVDSPCRAPTASGGGPVLQFRPDFLRLEATSFSSRHLASFCSGWECLSLFCRLLPCHPLHRCLNRQAIPASSFQAEKHDHPREEKQHRANAIFQNIFHNGRSPNAGVSKILLQNVSISRA